jgi:hypothetical protein
VLLLLLGAVCSGGKPLHCFAGSLNSTLPRLPTLGVCAAAGMDDVEEVVEEAPLPASSPSLDCGRELWRDFFSLTPASSNVPCTSLDFIAP